MSSAASRGQTFLNAFGTALAASFLKGHYEQIRFQDRYQLYWLRFSD